MACSLEYEIRLRRSGIAIIAGVDEAGRGCLAGAVVAAAVVLPDRFSLVGLDDSKKLSERRREAIFCELTARADVAWSVGVVGADEIDRINILRASHEAMRQAVRGLPVAPGHALIDGLPVEPFPVPQTAIVKGDGLSLSIAAASVIAKVTRDRMMAGLHARYPEFGFAVHKGYATAAHLAMLRKHGPCPIHRRTFAPVAQLTFVW